MFKKKKMAAEIVRLRYRVQELEERLCPCEQHQWLITNEECDVGTAPGDVTTYYTYKCRRCGKKRSFLMINQQVGASKVLAAIKCRQTPAKYGP